MTSTIRCTAAVLAALALGPLAVARVDAGDWVDYLQLAKWNGRWVIVNVLWELRPQSP